MTVFRLLLQIQRMNAGLTAAVLGSALLLPVMMLAPAATARPEGVAGAGSALTASLSSAEAAAGKSGQLRTSCALCGVIESQRELTPSAGASMGNPGENAATPARHYEITVRLRDGSMHVYTDTNSANWRYGERVNIIAGLN